jgi:hypothetical protein
VGGPAAPHRRFGLGSVSASLTLLGLVLYAASYRMALSYYEVFGVTVEDVGWSQVRAVGRSASYSALMGVGLAIVLLSPFGLGIMWVISRTWRAFRPDRVPGRLLRRLPSEVRWLIASGLAVMTIVAAVEPVMRLDDPARRAAQGLRAMQPNISDLLLPHAAGIDPVGGEAQWTELDAEGRQHRVRSYALFLGQNGGSTVLFDFCKGSTIRVPTDVFHLQQDGWFDDAASTSDAATPEDLIATYCRSVGRTPA